MDSDKYTKIGEMIANDILKNGLSLGMVSMLDHIERGLIQHLHDNLRLSRYHLSKLLGVDPGYLKRRIDIPPKVAPKNVPAEEFTRYLRVITIPENTHPDDLKIADFSLPK